MPWADCDPLVFWMVAVPVYGLALATFAAIIERWNKR